MTRVVDAEFEVDDDPSAAKKKTRKKKWPNRGMLAFLALVRRWSTTWPDEADASTVIDELLSEGVAAADLHRVIDDMVLRFFGPEPAWLVERYLGSGWGHGIEAVRLKAASVRWRRLWPSEWRPDPRPMFEEHIRRGRTGPELQRAIDWFEHHGLDPTPKSFDDLLVTDRVDEAARFERARSESDRLRREDHEQEDAKWQAKHEEIRRLEEQAAELKREELAALRAAQPSPEEEEETRRETSLKLAELAKFVGRETQRGGDHSAP